MLQCEHNRWIEYIYELVSRDVSIDPFIELLSVFGSGGRYYSLNLLAGMENHNPDNKGPWPAWIDTMDNFVRTETGFKEAFESVITSGKLDFTDLNRHAQNEIADRLQRFYDLLTEAGTHNLLGDDGKMWYPYAQNQDLDHRLSKRMDRYREQAIKLSPEKFTH